MNGSELQEDRTQSNSYSAALDESESLLPKPSGSVMPYVTQVADPLYTPPRTIHSYNPYHQPVVETRHANHNNATARTAEASAAPDLIADLVTENSRLADEVANLRRILHQQVCLRLYTPVLTRLTFLANFTPPASKPATSDDKLRWTSCP